MMTFNEFGARIFGTMRQWMLQTAIDPRRQLYKECGYPEDITPAMYRDMFDREGVATRVVNVLPEESWAMAPEIFEEEDPDVTTEFEEKLKELLGSSFVSPTSEEPVTLLQYLERLDKMSGIGHFGVMLIGLNDGQPLSEPAPGIDPVTGEFTTPPPGLRVTFLRVFDETLVTIKTYEKDETSPRFGRPVLYDIIFHDNRNESGSTQQNHVIRSVHWTRLVHAADNRMSSEVFGVPRQQAVFNRLCDCRKIMGGSAEMLWKGGFPGYSIETQPELGDVEVDTAAVRTEMEGYSNGLQRYIATNGMTVKSLAAQAVSPEAHLDIQIKMICLTIGVPYRVFIGSEEAKLSSTQDTKTWNKRLDRRRTGYITPLILLPTLFRLIAFGILPKPVKILVSWPDLNTSTDQERADAAAKMSTALATYVGASCDVLMAPKEYLHYVMGFDQATAAVIVKKAENRVDDLDIQGPLEKELLHANTPAPGAPAPNGRGGATSRVKRAKGA